MSQETQEYLRTLDEIERHLQREEFESCVRDCGALFEKALKALYDEALHGVRSIEERQAFVEAERNVTKSGQATFHNFRLGQLIHLFRESHAWKVLRRLKPSNLSKTGRISWDTVVSLRNAVAHLELASQDVVDGEDAEIMYYWVKTLIYDTELAGAASRGRRRAESTAKAHCPECKADTKPDWRYCPLCGVALATTCAECGEPLRPNWAICPACSAKVRGRLPPKERQARDEYRILCRGAYMDQVVNARERHVLNEKKLELGLSDEQAEAIERECTAQEIIEYQNFLTGVYIDGSVNEVERRFLERKTQDLGIDSRLAGEIEEQYRLTLQALEDTE